MAEAKTTKRHSSFLDVQNYKDMKKVKVKTGLSMNQQINEAVSRFYIPHMTDRLVEAQKKTNTLHGLSPTNSGI
jgi:hypothetical protein